MYLLYLIVCAGLLLDLSSSLEIVQPRKSQCLVVDACSGTPAIIEQEGTICLEDYEKDMDCAWIISSPFIGSVVRLEVTYFDIESCSSCSCDHLSAYDGDGLDGSLIDRRCGTETTTLFSLDQDMYLRFYSDHTREAGGFIADVTFYPIPRIAFHAVRFDPFIANNDPLKLPFQGLQVNIGAGFDISTSDFTCPRTGYYYFSIGAGTISNTLVNMILRVNRAPYVSALRTSTRHEDIDMLERGVVLHLDQGDVVDVLLSPQTGVYSDQGQIQTSFTGFILPFMHERDACVFAGTPDNTTNFGDVDGMEKRLVDIGDWGSDSSKFIVPRDGVYFSQYSTGCPQARNISLRKNSGAIISSYAGELESESYDTCSGGVVVEAEQGEEFTIYTTGSLFTNSELQISFSSFLVSSSVISRPSFSIARTTGVTELDIISFNILEQSDGIAVDLDGGLVTAIIPGHYFIYVGIETVYNYPAVVSIKKDLEVLSVITKLQADNDCSLAKSLLVHLDEGEEVHLELEEGRLYSTSARNVFMSGFLLYEDIAFLEAKRAAKLAERQNL